MNQAELRKYEDYVRSFLYALEAADLRIISCPQLQREKFANAIKEMVEDVMCSQNITTVHVRVHLRDLNSPA